MSLRQRVRRFLFDFFVDRRSFERTERFERLGELLATDTDPDTDTDTDTPTATDSAIDSVATSTEKGIRP